MHIGELFSSPEMELPRERTTHDFVAFLETWFTSYQSRVNLLNNTSGLCQRIRQNRSQIKKLSAAIVTAVQHYLDGSPSLAYDDLESGIRFVAANLSTLRSRSITGSQIGPLYRVARVGGSSVPPNRLFHAPFEFRHKVGQHRYGIPGFPCLYLGDSLELCLSELRVARNRVHSVAVSQFGICHGVAVNVLDFGLRPAALAPIALGRQIEDGKTNSKANPDLEAFLANYAICWPLMAASSVKVMYDGDPFITEYIVPQLILQWLMRNTGVDGIRYFSSRFNPEPKSVKGTINYVFPAVQLSSPGKGHSPRLKSMFELSNPVIWGRWKQKKFRAETRAKEAELATLNRSRLP
jgi:hypothetical protein